MKSYIIITLFVLALAFSCRQRQQNRMVANVDYLSKWFTENEDSLYTEFVKQVRADYLCKTGDTTWGEVVYQKADSISYMGRFTSQAKKYCDSIDVSYFYNRFTTPNAGILLSLNYNRNYTKALDSILNFVTAKHFNVEKYEQPNLNTDIFGFEKSQIVVKDLRLEINPHDTLKDITVFIHGKPEDMNFAAEHKDYLKHQLFGEELLLKKINNIDFKMSDTINPNLLTLDEARLELK